MALPYPAPPHPVHLAVTVPEYVHDEAFMLQALRECGWTLTARTPVSRSRGVHYYFYLLAGRGANGAEPGRMQGCLRAGGKLDSD